MTPALQRLRIGRGVYPPGRCLWRAWIWLHNYNSVDGIQYWVFGDN